MTGGQRTVRRCAIPAEASFGTHPTGYFCALGADFHLLLLTGGDYTDEIQALGVGQNPSSCCPNLLQNHLQEGLIFSQT